MITFSLEIMAKTRRKKEIDDNICPICKYEMFVRCTGYSKQPFVNGKKYEAICHTCWATLKNNGELYTPEELVEDGFDIKQAKASVKAIKISIKKYKS